MKINRRQLRRLIESTLNESVSSADRAFLDSVMSVIPPNILDEKAGLITLGTNEQGKKGALIRDHISSGKSPSLIDQLQRAFPGKTVEYLPFKPGGQYERSKEYNITVQGTEPTPGSGPGVIYEPRSLPDLVIIVSDGREIQSQFTTDQYDMGGAHGLFSFGPTYFVEM